MYQDPVQPVEGVSSQGQIDQYHQDAISQEANWEKALKNKQAVHTYSCYFMVIELINHVGLDKLDSAVIAESQLMDVQHQMQESMVDIGKFISELQSQEAGYHSFGTPDTTTPFSQALGLPSTAAPDTFLGLNSDYYNMDMQGNDQFGKTSTFQKSLSKFKTAIKKIFYCNSDSSAPTVSQLSTITNPNVYQHGQDFNLSSFWNQLSDLYGAAGFNRDGLKMVSGVATDHASLLQQYMYYKAQVAVYTGSADGVDAAKGDITKLVNFAPVGDKADPFITQLLQPLNQLDISVSVSNSGNFFNSVLNTQSGDILDMVLKNQDKNNNGQVGLYGAFNFMAYNSYWAKPNAVDGISSNPANAGVQIDGQGNSNGDVLASVYTNVNSVQASIGNDTSTNSTVMQEISSNESEIVNVGQNAIQSLNQAVASLSMNQISA